MKYEAVIGLEVHAQLLTESKIFCGCAARFGAPPNTQVCPVCLGMPGVLPVLNRRVVEFATRMAIATNCRINRRSIFARKNYFYPDLPKGYQISQYDKPLAEDGYIDIEVGGEIKRIGITRIHMEEDAGKLLHGAGGGERNTSFVDFNRAGVPLIEIVSKPDMRTAEEASEYLKALRDILIYLEICDGNMEQGSLRCDANISIRIPGVKELGTKTELKNMNSFKFIRDALDYEIRRQIDTVNDGGKVIHETRLFDTAQRVTVSMRGKEEAHDYRYFPDPDLPPLELDDAWVEKIRGQIPELPWEKRLRFINEYNIPSYDAGVLTASRSIADFYESCVEHYPRPKIVSNWVMGEVLRLLKSDEKDIRDCPVTPAALSGLLKMIEDERINARGAKDVLEEIYRSGKPPESIIKEKGIVQISDEDDILKVIEKVLEENMDSVKRYKAGRKKLFGFFVGQVMKATGGRANPKLVNRLLNEKLSS